MTESFEPGTRSDAPANGATASAGTVLRRSREAAGLHIAALAVSLKVPVKKLEALEADRLDLLPDAVFARALAGSVCRTLRLDPNAVLPLLPPSGLPRLNSGDNGRITPSFRSPNFGSRTPWWTQVSRPAVLAGLVFVVGAALLFLLPKAADKHDTAVTTEVVSAVSSAQPAPVAPAPALPPVDTALPDAAPAAPSAASSPVVVAASSASPSAVAANPVVASSAVAPAQSLAPTATSKATSATSLVTFTTTKASWIEVIDARGTSVLRRQLAAGEVVGVSGVPPLKALVGRADSTQVQVRGQALDLTPLSKDNVARFEVK